MNGLLLGIILVMTGVLVLVFGDKKLEAKNGKIAETVSVSPLQARTAKWVVGLLFIWFGAAILFGGINL